MRLERASPIYAVQALDPSATPQRPKPEALDPNSPSSRSNNLPVHISFDLTVAAFKNKICSVFISRSVCHSKIPTLMYLCLLWLLCMCFCVCVCVCGCVLACLFVLHRHVRTHWYGACVCEFIYIYVYVHVYDQNFIYIYVYICRYTYVYMYMYIYTHIVV